MSRLGERKGVNSDLEPWSGEGAGEDSEGTLETQMQKRRQAQQEKAYWVVSGYCLAGHCDESGNLFSSGSSSGMVCSWAPRICSEDTTVYDCAYLSCAVPAVRECQKVEHNHQS